LTNALSLDSASDVDKNLLRSFIPAALKIEKHHKSLHTIFFLISSLMELSQHSDFIFYSVSYDMQSSATASNILFYFFDFL
jgi:hypothetical protein